MATTNASRALVLLAWLGVAPAVADDAGPRYDRRWMYAAHNLLVDRNVDAVIALFERASKAGYNGLMLADHK
jgi:hypothetical protein